MPITAVVLIAEFTHMRHAMLVPIVLAVAGSVAAARLCKMLGRKPCQDAPTQGASV
jgi:H+/Cl- antiporter ClcA